MSHGSLLTPAERDGLPPFPTTDDFDQRSEPFHEKLSHPISLSGITVSPNARFPAPAAK